jgi:hypothetical protein
VIDNVVLFVNEESRLGVSRVTVSRLWSSEPRLIRHRVALSTSALGLCVGIWWLKQHILHATKITASR